MNNFLEEFIMDYKENIYRLAYSYVHNKDDALDIVQESIYKAMRAKSLLQDRGELKSWFYRIVVNTALDLLRKRRKVQPIEEEQLHAIMAGAEDAYADLDLERTLASLPDKYRTLIVLRFFEDLTIEEVAQVMKENVNTVKARLYRVLKLLRIQLEDTVPERSGEHGSTPRTVKNRI